MSVSNHQRLDCLLNRLFGRKSKKISKLRVTGLYEEDPSVTDGFPSQRASPQKMFPFDDAIIVKSLLMPHPVASDIGWDRAHTPGAAQIKRLLNRKGVL